MAARIIASFLGTGLLLGRARGSDAGSGTVGALVAAAIALWIGTVAGWVWVLVGSVLLTAAGLWAAGRVAAGDAGWIVIDEAAGAFVSLIGITQLPAAVAAFVVFRLADIFKSAAPGVRAAEGLPGAAGIMMDDLVAAVYGLAVGHLIQALY
jgi:phosphatidylglycerophosphatase A